MGRRRRPRGFVTDQELDPLDDAGDKRQRGELSPAGITASLMTVAQEVCGGRIVVTHEGGYSAASVPFYGLAVMETLSGISTGVRDPFQPLIDGFGQQELQPHQDAAIRLAGELLDGLPLI